MEAIEAQGLTRDYDGLRAVDHLSFRVARGETLALLGPNGAGKTTTVAMLTTLLRPSGGGARVAGFDVAQEPELVRASIGVVFQGPSLELQLTARENLRFHAKLYGLPRRLAGERMAELLRFVELEARADEAVYRFSGGMRRRLEIARALLHQPQVLFLDEPTIGLDPQARLNLWDLLQGLRREGRTTVFLTTHYMEEADRLADRVAILDHGRLLRLDSPARLKASLGQEVVRLRVARGKQALARALEALKGRGGVEEVAWEGDVARVCVRRAEDALPLLLEAARGAGVRLAGIDVHRPTLEDVFLAHTGRALREEM